MGWVYALEAAVTVALMVLIFRRRRDHPGIMLIVMYVICVLTSLMAVYTVWGAEYGHNVAAWMHAVPWAVVNAITIFMGGGDFDFAQAFAGNPYVGPVSMAYECSRLCALFTLGTVIVSLFTGAMMDRLRVMFRIGRCRSVIRVHFPEHTDVSQINDFVKTLEGKTDDDTLVSINRPSYYQEEDLGRRVKNLVFQESIVDRAARKAQEVVDIRFGETGVSVDTRLRVEDESKVVPRHGGEQRDAEVKHDVIMMDYDDMVARDYIARVFIPEETRRIKGYSLDEIGDLRAIKPTKVLIIGDLAGLGGQILRRVVMNSQRPSEAESHATFRLGQSADNPSDVFPDITFCTFRKDETLGAYRGRYPMLDEFASIKYLDCGAESEELYNVLKESLEDGNPFDYVVVAGSDTIENSHVARDIRFYLVSHMKASDAEKQCGWPNIAAYAEEESLLAAVQGADVHNAKPAPSASRGKAGAAGQNESAGIQTADIKYFGSRSQLYALDGLKNGDMDHDARLINAFYCVEGGKHGKEEQWDDLIEEVKGKECEQWNGVSQFDRNSSRASAEFIEVQNAWRERLLDIEGKKNVDLRIMQLEHLRWCAFLAAMGFTPMSDDTCEKRFNMAHEGNAYWRNSFGTPEKVRKDSVKDCMKFARADTPDCLNSSYEHICLTPWDNLDYASDICNQLGGKNIAAYNFKENDYVVLSLLKFIKHAQTQDGTAKGV